MTLIPEKGRCVLGCPSHVVYVYKENGGVGHEMHQGSQRAVQMFPMVFRITELMRSHTKEQEFLCKQVQFLHISIDKKL